MYVGECREVFRRKKIESSWKKGRNSKPDYKLGQRETRAHEDVYEVERGRARKV